MINQRMAKFNVFFKDNPIHSAIFATGVVHIGRDESNDLSIDSLAFAPAHAAVILRDHENIIKQLNADFPLIINGEHQSKHYLKNGDIITVGKHRIIYNPEEKKPATATSPLTLSTDKVAEDQQAVSQSGIAEASLQIMTGKHIGRIVPLKKNMTRIGRDGTGIIVITHRKTGYFASVLEPDDNLRINNIALTDNSILLKNSDILLINNISMKFIWPESP